MKFIIFRFYLVLFLAEFMLVGIYLVVFGFARLRWVLPAAAVFCLLLLCSACCCLLLFAAVGFCTLVLILPICGGFCLLVVDSALYFWGLFVCV